ncbi:MAG: hypothetical protein AAGK32_21830, partial [Actinomycetota bacterium]
MDANVPVRWARDWGVDDAEGEDGRTGRPALVDWLFRDRTTGRITIAQPPNPPLWIFLASVVARWFV